MSLIFISYTRVRIPPYLHLIVGLCLAIVQNASSASFEVAGQLSYEGAVKIANEEGAPLLYFQSTASDILVTRPGGTPERVPVYASTLVDVQEDNSQILCFLDQGHYLPTATYLASPQGGTWRKLPDLPGYPGTHQARGITPSGLVYGDVPGQFNIYWLLDSADQFIKHTWPGSEQVTSIGAEGQVLAANAQWWTADKGVRPLPQIQYSSDRVSAVSSDGRWLVTFEEYPAHPWLNRLVRWHVDESGEPTSPEYHLLPRELEAVSFARVLDDGTVFTTLTTESGGALRDMDAYVWHAHGTFQRLADAVADDEDTRLPQGWQVMGKIEDVSADGRWIAGAKETPDSISVNEDVEIWFLCLDAPLAPPPATDRLMVHSSSPYRGNYTIRVANGGAAPLTLLSAEMTGAEAGRFTLSPQNPELPLVLPPGAATILYAHVADARLDARARLKLTTDSTDTPEHEEELEFLSSTLPEIWLQKPSSAGIPPGPVTITPEFKLAIGRSLDFTIQVSNSSAVQAENCRLVIGAGEGLNIFVEGDEPFSLAAGAVKRFLFTVTADRAGEFTPVFDIEGAEGFRIQSQADIKIIAVPAGHLEWRAADGVTTLDPATEILDFGDIPVGGLGSMDIRLAHDHEEVLDIFSFNTRNTEVHAYAVRASSSSYTPTMQTWDKIYTAENSGILQQRLAMSPKALGVMEGVIRFDARGAAAPVHVRVRCNGVSASGLFLEEPGSAILLNGEKITVRARGNGIQSVRDVPSNINLQLTGPDEYSYSPGTGLRQLQINMQGGPVLSRSFQIVRISATGSYDDRGFQAGQDATLSVPDPSADLRYEWLKDGVTLTPSARIISERNSLILKQSQPEDAGEYSCLCILDAPEGEITRILPVTRLTLLPPDVAPQPVPFSLRPAREGEFIQFFLTSPNQVDKWTISGLPPGLKLLDNKVEGFITHKAASDEPRVYEVRVQATYQKMTGPEYIVPWTIEPFTDSGLAGTYHGLIERVEYFAEGAALKLTLNAKGTGTFSLKGPKGTADRGRIYLAGRSPAGLPEEYDPPLPDGLAPPTPTPTIVGVGRVKRGVQPNVLTLVPGDASVLAGSFFLQNASAGIPVAAFKHTRQSRELLPKGASPRFSMHLKLPENTWIWRSYNRTDYQPGTSSLALTFTDAQGRPNLLGSRGPSNQPSDDHWIWDPVALTWVEGHDAALIPPASPRLNVTPNQVTWQSPNGGDVWVLTLDGGLWKWPMDGSGWQVIQADLPVNSPGHSGVFQLPDVANRPRGRSHATTWVTANGDLWMFGGTLRKPIPWGNPPLLADLWRYQPQTGLWTWMAGRAALPEEDADWRSDGILEPDVGTGPSWVGKDGRLWLHQGRQSADFMWAFDPVSATWSLEYQSTGPRIIPGHGNWSHTVLDPPEIGTTPGGRSPRAMTWTGTDGRLYLFGGHPNSAITSENQNSADFYIWHYEPDDRRWVCDGLQAGGFNAGGLGFSEAQTWQLPDGRVFLRGGIRSEMLNQSDPLSHHLFEYSPHPLEKIPGFLSVQVSANGTLRWTGRLPDNEAMTGSGGMSRMSGDILAGLGLPEGTWVSGFYSLLDRSSRACIGIIGIQEQGQECLAMLDWARPEAVTVAGQRILPGGFPVSVLEGSGWRHDPQAWQGSLPTVPLPLAPIQELPANELTFGLDSRGRLTLDFQTWKPDKMKVNFKSATGLLSVTGTLPDPSYPKGSRPWNLQGLLIPQTKAAAGHFTLPMPLDATLVPVERATETQISLGGFDSGNVPLPE